MPSSMEKYTIKLELPESLDLNDIKESVEDATGFVIKETESAKGVRWVVVNPDDD